MGLNTTTEEAAARLVTKSEKIADNGFTLIRQWPFLDATVVDTLSQSLASSDTVTNPQADGETYTGTFAASEIISAPQRSDDNERYVNITQTLIQLGTATSMPELAALNYIQKDENEIINEHARDTAEFDTRTCIWTNINPASRSTFLGFADGDLVSQFASGYTYEDRIFDAKDDNTATFTVIFKNHAYSNTSGTTPNRVLSNTIVHAIRNYDAQNDTAGFERSQVDGGDKIPIAALEEIMNNQVADSGWFITDVSTQDDGEGGGVLRRSQIKARAQADHFIIKFQASNGNNEEMEVRMWKDLTSNDATGILTDAQTESANMYNSTWPSPLNHVLYTVQRIPKVGIDANGYERFDVVRITYIPKHTTSIKYDRFETGDQVMKVEHKRFRTVTGDDFESSTKHFVRHYRRVTDTEADAKSWADGSSSHPVDATKMGWYYYEEARQVWVSWKIQLHNNGLTTYASATWPT